jgi:hypothetical protein
MIADQKRFQGPQILRQNSFELLDSRLVAHVDVDRPIKSHLAVTHSAKGINCPAERVIALEENLTKPPPCSVNLARQTNLLVTGQ